MSEGVNLGGGSCKNGCYFGGLGMNFRGSEILFEPFLQSKIE